ncbi:MAG: class II aldolase/adducin family protein [Desulfitobacterium hafniense]|nr:class II aldolase/adducin family protein [Desulfitobacterium hafniense]
MLRERLLAVGRELYSSGMIAGTWGNISVWDDVKNAFWITPSGMDYLTLVPEDLVLIDITGQTKEGFRKPSSEFLMHLDIYRARSDVKGIVHTHSVYATAHAVANKCIPPIVEDMAQIVGGSVETASYELPGTEELALAVVVGLGEKNAVLLANHGLVGVGRNLEEAFKVCQVVEKGAQIHLMSYLLGTPVLLSDEDVRKMRSDYLNKYGQRKGE